MFSSGKFLSPIVTAGLPAPGPPDAAVEAVLELLDDELLLPHAEANPVLINLWAIWGPVSRGLGLLAAADDRPQDAAAHFSDALRLAGEWGAQGWALRTIGDWLTTGVPVPDRAALVNHGLVLARELGLPAVAARIADEAQTVTPGRTRSD